MNRHAAVLALTALLLPGCLANGDDTQKPPSAPAEAVDLLHRVAVSDVVRLETNRGTIDLVVYTNLMPATAGHFLTLVDAGAYDNTQVHRVVDDFVIQGGTHTGTDMEGSGTTVPHEWHPALQYGPGGVGLARDLDLDSGDNQWFITETPQTRLSDPNSTTAQEYGTYAMFAQVVAGFDIVQDIADDPVVAVPAGLPLPGIPGIPVADRPVVPVIVQRAYRLEADFDPWVLPLAPVTLAEGVTLVRPLHLYGGHSFQATLVLDAVPEAPPTMAVDGEPLPAMVPDPADGRRWMATVTLPAGHHALNVTASGATWGQDVTAWHVTT